MTVSLTEQMGAMALVDALRHRALELQDHLDLPKRRAEVAERIRAYYQSNGITYDDAQVDEGVRAFFDRRLVFEAPALSYKERLLVRLAMARRVLLTLVGASLMILTLALCINGVRDIARTGEAMLALKSLAEDDQALHRQLAAARLRLGELQARQQRQPEPAVAALLEQAGRLLPSDERHYSLDRQPASVERGNREQVKAEVAQARLPLDHALQAVAGAQTRLAAADAVYQQRERLDALRQSPPFAAARPYFPELDTQAGNADQQLQQLRQADQLPAVTALITQLATQLDGTQAALALFERQSQLLQRIEAMPLSKADRQQLLQQATPARRALEKHDWPAAEQALAQLQRYLDYAAEPLTVDIVDRPGIKSGVERCYEQAGCSPDSVRGKSWYLVVEALDPTGVQVSVPVTSVEDAEKRWADLFAVRVSRAEYLKVKDDKLDDGHIGQRRIAVKPANALGLRFNARASANPDMILNW